MNTSSKQFRPAFVTGRLKSTGGVTASWLSHHD
jgi:hypothetical protein